MLDIEMEENGLNTMKKKKKKKKKAEEEGEPRSFAFPKRYLMVGLLSLVVAFDFSCRASLRRAVLLLTEQYKLIKTNTQNASEVCKHLTHENEIQVAAYEDMRKTTYGWNLETRPLPAKYFFIGYILMHPVAGYFADKYGSKYVVNFGLLASSLLSFLTPTLIDSTDGALMMLRMLRIVHGAFSGLVHIAVVTTVAHWVPIRHRTLQSTAVFVGLNIGMILQTLLTDRVIRTQKNWGIPSYIYGGVGIVISLIWWLFAASNPNQCPGITLRERKYLQVQFENTVDHEVKQIPWRSILLSRAVWAFNIGSFGYIFIFNFAGFYLESYMEVVLKLSADESELWSSLTFVLMGAISFVTAVFSDYGINSYDISTSTLRKTFGIVGTTGATIYMVGGSIAGCRATLANAMFSIAMGMEGCSVASLRLVPFDLSPNYAGILYGISGAISLALGLFLAPVVEGMFPNRTLVEYRNVFLFMVGASTLSIFVFFIFGTADLQTWNTPPRKAVKNKSRI